MKKTQWTNRRLERLFLRYNKRYWEDRLPHYKVAIRKMRDALGLCKLSIRKIYIDTNHISSDRMIHSVLLHEMAHAAEGIAGKWYGSHNNIQFLSELEKLLEKGAPIRIGSGELPDHNFLSRAIPARFPLLRQAMKRAEVMEKKEFPQLKIPLPEVDPVKVAWRFEMLAKYEWDKALAAGNRFFGLCDALNTPINGRAEDLISIGKTAHEAARRKLLMLIEEFERLAPHITWGKAKCQIGKQHGLLDPDGRPRTSLDDLILVQCWNRFRIARRKHLSVINRFKEFHSNISLLTSKS